MRFSTLLSAGALAGASAAASVSTISSVGNKFFKEDGSQFFMKGIAYQLDETDPLIDGDQCARDVALMKTLGTNTIRVYHVDASADHSSCMSELANAGIYTLIDLDTFNTYIYSPTMDEPSWNETQRDHYAAVMDAFASYSNVLGFFIGNEVISLANQSLAAPYIKAAVRDMKAYRKSKNYREIPIGYSAADIAELRPMLQDYLTCGDTPDDNIDFFGLNSYEWCDPQTYTGSGYSSLEAQAKDFPVPIFFSETGCNQPGPRLFADQASILGPDMDSDWSGAIVYEWIQEANKYGLVSYGSGSTTNVVRSGTPNPVTPDFANLKAQWATLTPTGVARSAYNADSVSTRACPASTAGGWLVDGDVPLPSLGARLATTATGTAATATATATATAKGTSTGAAAAASSTATGSAKSAATALSANSLGREVMAAGAAMFGVMVVFALL